MVIVTNYSERQKETGEKFLALILESGELELIKSQKTGNFYATTKKISLPTTMNKTMCKAMIGKKLPGRIVKESCEPYNYEVNGEVIVLTHKYRYSEEMTIEESVFEGAD